MRKKLTSLFIVFCMLLTMMPNIIVFAASSFSGGSGTEASPYLISSADDFIQLATDVNGGTNYDGFYFKQTVDVSLSTTGGFVPIGTYSMPFKGTFDGDNKTVTLDINDTTNAHVGLFGCVIEGTVKNVVTAGSVKATAGNVGGIVGYVIDGIITNCINGAAVTCESNSYTNEYAGGIVGYNSGGTVVNCINKGSVSGYQRVGGICGFNCSLGNILNCYNKGAVEGNNYVGGISGYEDYTWIKYCVNNGTVSSDRTYIGGVAGYLQYADRNENCYYNSTLNSSINAAGNLEITGSEVSSDEILGENIITTLNLLIETNPTVSTDDGTTVTLNYWKVTDGVVSFTAEKPELPYMITNNSGYLLGTPGYADQGETVTVTPKETTYANVTGITVTDASGTAVTVTKADDKYTFTMPGSAVTIEASSEMKFTQSDGIYLLNSPDDMKALATAHVEDYSTTGLSFKLTDNLSLSTEGGFVPIGTNGNPFKGMFDGDGHTVTLNLTGTEYYTALFGKSEGIIKNVNTTGSVNSTRYYVAGIAANSESGKVVNCTNSAAISGSSTVGGIVGGYANMIINCYNSGNIKADNENAGGIIGYAASGTTVKNCVNSGTVTASSKAGAVAGKLYDNSNYFSDNCYVTDTADTGIGSIGNTAQETDDNTKTKAVEKSVLFTEDGLNTMNAYASTNTADGISLYYWVLEDGEIALRKTTDTAIKFTITNTADYLTVQDIAAAGDSVEIATNLPSYMVLKSVKVNDTVVEPDADGKYIFTMPQANVTVSSEWDVNLTKDTNGVYQINSAEDMITLANAVSNGYNSSGQSFKLTANVSLSTGDGFIPIGTDEKPFKGTFDGGGYTVTLNLTGTEYYTALFGKNAGTIKNVHTAGSVTSTKYYVAGIAAHSGYGKVINCTNSAAVSGYNTVGGIVGGYGDVINCYNSGNIKADNESAGGIIGFADGSTVRNCINSGTVTALSKAGAVAGKLYDNSNYFSDNCYVTDTADTGIGSIGNTAQTTDDNTKTKAVDAAHLTADGLIEHNLYVKENGNGELLYWTVSGDKIVFTDEEPTNLPYDIHNDSADILEVAESESAGATVTVTAKTSDYMTVTEVKAEDADGNPVTVTVSGDGKFTFTMPKSEVYVSAIIKFYEPEKDGNGVYLIKNVGNLYVFCMMVNGGNNDIDAKVTAEELDMTSFELGIGTSEYPYKGEFDGNNALIHTRESLFGITRNAVIKNINAKTTVTQDYNGGLVYEAYDTQIDNCKVNANISGELGAGIVYSAEDSVITNCEVTASGGVNGFGGIAMNTYDTVIANCILNESDISASYYGGIVNDASSGTKIYNCVSLDYIECYEAGGIIASTTGEVITENNFYICDEGFNRNLLDACFDYDEYDYYYDLKDKNSAVTLEECSKLYMTAMLNKYIKANPNLVSGVTLNKWGAVYDDTTKMMMPCFETEDSKVYMISFSNITVASAPYGAVAGDEVSIDFPVDSTVTVTDANGDEVPVLDGTFTMPEANVKIEITMDSGISETKVIDGKTYVVVKTAEDFIKAVTSIANGNNVLNVYIANDIVLSESDSANYPQYTMDSEYNGTFDGGGNTVSFENLTGDNTAMLDVIGEDGVVKNITISGSISGNVSAAGIALVNNGVIYNCINAAGISETDCAGIAYENGGVIINCMNIGNVSGSNAGAICTYNENSVLTCVNTGVITSVEDGDNTFVFYNEGTESDNIDFDTESSDMTPAECAAEMNYSLYYLNKCMEVYADSYAESLNMDLYDAKKMISELSKWSAVSGELVWADDVNKPYYYVVSQSGNIPHQVGSAVEVSFDTSGVEEGFEIHAAIITDNEDNEIEATAVEGKEGTYTFTMPDSVCKAKMLVVPSSLKSEKGEDGRLYYLIYTLDDLMAVKAAVDIGNTEINAKLMADIETEYTASPIGNGAYMYNGVFDGNGHSIKLNMSDSEGAFRYFGLFGMLDTDAVVKNLKTTGAVSGRSDKYYVGGIAGFNNGLITNCTNEAEISGYYAGGIAGDNEARAEFNVIELLSVAEMDLLSAEEAELLSAEESGSGMIKNCVNNGYVDGEYAGGIISRAWNTIYAGLLPDNAATIIGCTNNATVYGNSYSGGIAAQVYGDKDCNVIVKDCVNNGEIEGAVDDSEVGGIIADGGRVFVDSCENNGDVSGCYSGGIVEYITGDAIIRNCENNGNIIGTEDGGGITSYAESECRIINCMNNGAVSAWGAGGIAGDSYDKLIIDNCYNSGSVSGSNYAYTIAYIDSGECSITNTYYTASDIPSSNLSANADKSSAVTAEQVANGEVSEMLNNNLRAGLRTWATKDGKVVFADATHSSSIYADGVTDDGKTIVKCDIDELTEYIVVYAHYDENDVLVSMQIIKGGTEIEAETNSKIMVFESLTNPTPICEAYIVN